MSSDDSESCELVASSLSEMHLTYTAKRGMSVDRETPVRLVARTDLAESASSDRSAVSEKCEESSSGTVSDHLVCMAKI